MLKKILIFFIKLIRALYRNLANKKYASFVLPFGAGIILLIATIGSSFFDSGTPTQTKTKLSTSPNFLYSPIDGNQKYDFTLNKTKSVILFWQTWCLNCTNIIQKLADLPSVQNDKVKLFVISSNEEQKATELFIKSNSLTNSKINYSYDVNGELFKTFDVIKTPQIFFVNEDKKILDTEIFFSTDEYISIVNAFADNYPNTTQSQYIEGVKISINPSSLKIICEKPVETFNIPNPLKPKDDKNLDCITSVDSPQFQEKKITTVEKDSKYIQVKIGSTTNIYPIDLLHQHVVINDLIENIPIAVVFDPFSYSVNVYNRNVSGKTSTFGVSGRILEHSIVIYDRETISFWNKGKAVYGSQTGLKLEELPFNVIKGSEIPDNSFVMQIPSYTIDYSVNSFKDFWTNDSFLFPVSFEKTKESKEIITTIPNNTVKLGTTYFSNVIGNQNLEFEQSGEYFKDKTGSLWNKDGLCIQGPLRGNYLEQSVIKFGMIGFR